MKQKVTLGLSNDAAALLEVNATERRRGELVSQIIVEHFKRGIALPESKEGVALAAISAGVRRIEAALGRIERKLG